MIQLSLFDVDTRPPVIPMLPKEGVNLYDELRRYQEWLIEQALVRSGGKKAGAARLLGLKRTTLVMMLKAQAASIRRRAAVSFDGALGVGDPVASVCSSRARRRAAMGSAPGLPARDRADGDVEKVTEFRLPQTDRLTGETQLIAVDEFGLSEDGDCGL